MDDAVPARAGASRGVKPRSDRYRLSPEEEQAYRRFVDMLSQLEKGARLQLAESSVKDAAQAGRVQPAQDS